MTGSKEVVKGLLNQLLTFSHVTVENNARLKVLGYGKVVITPELSIERSYLLNLSHIIYFPLVNYAMSVTPLSLINTT